MNKEATYLEEWFTLGHDNNGRENCSKCGAACYITDETCDHIAKVNHNFNTHSWKLNPISSNNRDAVLSCVTCHAEYNSYSVEYGANDWDDDSDSLFMFSCEEMIIKGIIE